VARNILERNLLKTKIERLDSIAEEITDYLSPLTIKEVRQSMKGKLFLSSFLLGIVACLIPSIYFASTNNQVQGKDAFFIFSVILFSGVGVVFPFMAFASLHEDRLNSTYELMGITKLNSHQLVWGKWQSSMVQVSLFISSVMPFLTYSYFMKGISFISILAIVIIAFVFAQAANLFGILAGSLSHLKKNRMILYLLFVFVGVGFLCVAGGIGLAHEASRGSINQFLDHFWKLKEIFWITLFIVSMTIAFEWFLFELAAGQLAPVTSNRSSRCRYALTLVYILFIAFAWVMLDYLTARALGRSYGYSSSLWLARSFSAMFAFVFVFVFTLSLFILGETDELSPLQHKKYLNSSGFLSRIWKTLYMSGRSSGYLFLLSMLVLFQFLFLITDLNIFDQWAKRESILFYFFNAVFFISFIYLINNLSIVKKLTAPFRRIATIVILVLFVAGPLMFFWFDNPTGKSFNVFNPICFTEYGRDKKLRHYYSLVNAIAAVLLCIRCIFHIIRAKREIQTIRKFDAGERGASQ